MATLNFNSGKNFIIPTENDMTYRGLGGDDVYIISKAIDNNTKIQIIDTEGSNTIQLIDGLTIANSLFTKNATRLTLSNGSEITINGADKFTYETSGNSTTGDIGQKWTYSDFVRGMGVVEGPPASGSKNGATNLLINDNFEVPKETNSGDNSTNEYTIVDIDVTSDTTITATSLSEDFRYEVGTDGVSAEGNYEVIIEGFDKSNDKEDILIIGDSQSQDLVNVVFEAELDTTYEFSSFYITARCGVLFVEDRSGREGYNPNANCNSDSFVNANLQSLMSAADQIWVVSRWYDGDVEYMEESIVNIRSFNENIVVFGGKEFGSVSANWYMTNDIENWQTPILKESDRQIFIDLADRSDSIREIVLSLGALFVDSQQLLCDGLPFCSNFVDGDLISYDGIHFTPFGAELFGSKLKAAGENTFLNSEK